jgi:hypothetical protein
MLANWTKSQLIQGANIQPDSPKLTLFRDIVIGRQLMRIEKRSDWIQNRSLELDALLPVILDKAFKGELLA